MIMADGPITPRWLGRRDLNLWVLLGMVSPEETIPQADDVHAINGKARLVPLGDGSRAFFALVRKRLTACSSPSLKPSWSGAMALLAKAATAVHVVAKKLTLAEDFHPGSTEVTHPIEESTRY